MNKHINNQKVKFMYNGIKVDKKLFKANYSMGPYTNLPEGTITIYAREYEGLPKLSEFKIENNSDLMTDYFEKDKVIIFPNDPIYTEVKEGYQKYLDWAERKQIAWVKRHQTI